MSYVLEALKKQEAEENPDAAVALSLATQREHRHRRLAVLLWAALAVNLCVLGALLLWPGRLLQWGNQGAEDLPPTPPAAHAPASSASSGIAASTPAPASSAAATPAGPTSGSIAERGPEQSAPALTKPVDVSAPAAPAETRPATAGAQQPPSSQRSLPPSPPPAPLPARPRPPATPVSLEELPAPVRGRFPGIVFSTHIYADDHDLRAVVANGQRLGEGDRLGAVKVSQITETGVVLAFEDYLISIPVVGFWDTP